MAVNRVLHRAVAIESTFAGVHFIYNDLMYGSGAVIHETDSEIYLVTAAHVATQDGILVGGNPCEVVAVHETTDLALLRAQKPEGFSKVFVFAEPTLGQKARYLGFSGPKASVVTSGTVSSLNWGIYCLYDGGIHPGLSGGPILSENGRILGIGVGAAVSRSRGFVNPTFAIFVPSWIIQEFLRENLPEMWN